MDSNSAVAADRSLIVTRLLNLWSRIRISQLWMLIIALFLRIGWILLGHTYRFKPAENNFGFGWEMGRIAEAIASGRGFSDPFGAHTGPTAWEPPLYPYLIATVFHFFGIYSRASAFILLSINSIFSALTCIPIFLIARRIFSEKVAVGAAWTWALLPYVMYWCTRWVWETSLSALLLALIFWLALTMEDRNGLKPWLAFGLLWGIATLNSTVLIAFLPASGLWAWYHRAKLRKQSVAGIVLASMIFSHASLPGPSATIVLSENSSSSATISAQNFASAMAPAPTAPGCSIYILRRIYMRCASTPPWENSPTSKIASNRR